eukprot:evm.model.scf_116.6 EVM.evm.TU.scf_116.6   scf_116:58160-64021(-)
MSRVLSWDPRVFYYPQFLTEMECKHLIKTAIPKTGNNKISFTGLASEAMCYVQLKKSVVYDAKGQLIVDNIRTSYGTFLRRRHDPVVRNISERAARITHTPAVYQEDLQVLRYGNRQYYNAHFDTNRQHLESHRYITVVMYLAGYVFDQGDAVMFYSVMPDGSVDEKTRHAGCPVLQGTKWTSTIWVHTNPWREQDFHDDSVEDVIVDPGICQDYHNKCPTWASDNECEKNEEYMVGKGDKIGSCRKSCFACDVCTADDRECYRKNREQAGYLDLDVDNEIRKAFPV